VTIIWMEQGYISQTTPRTTTLEESGITEDSDAEVPGVVGNHAAIKSGIAKPHM